VASGFRALGGVLGEVAGDLLLSQRSFDWGGDVRVADDSDVELLTPSDEPAVPALPAVGVRWGAVGGGREGALEGAAQLWEPRGGWGRGGDFADNLRAVGLLVDEEGGVEGVEADQSVQVDDAASLHLGDLGERCPRPVRLERLVDLDQGAAPQLGDVGIPDDLSGVVVAVQAERLPEQRVPILMPEVAAQGAAVGAGLGKATGPAGAGVAVRSSAGGVHGPEGRGGGGDEHTRVPCDRRGHALAADEPGLDQLVGVRPVQAGAGRADAGAAIPARRVDHGVRQVQRRR
jgi:hypothetical protein